LSYQRIDPGAPADLANDSLFINEELVEPLPFTKGAYRTKASCKRCDTDGWAYDRKLLVCPKCSSPNAKVLNAGQRFYPTPQNVSAHHRRPLMVCWNQKEDAVTGEISKHDYIEEKIPVITVTTVISGVASNSSPGTDYEHHLEVRCKNCGMAYQRIDGRRATPDEVESFKQGKIEKASKFLGQNWSNQQ